MAAILAARRASAATERGAAVADLAFIALTCLGFLLLALLLKAVSKP